jgi:hypothetical protein
VSVAADIAGSPAGTTSLAAAWVSVVGDAGAAAEVVSAASSNDDHRTQQQTSQRIMILLS